MKLNRWNPKDFLQMQVVRLSKSKQKKLFIFLKTNLIKLEVILVFEDQWIYCRVIDKNRWK